MSLRKGFELWTSVRYSATNKRRTLLVPDKDADGLSGKSYCDVPIVVISLELI
jgi:hypothetical protein